MLQQVDNTVGVTPLVVIPGHNLEHTLLTGKVVLEGGKGIVDGGTLVVNEVSGDQLLIGVSQEAVQVGGGGLLEGLVDILDGSVVLGDEGKVDNRHIGKPYRSTCP